MDERPRIETESYSQSQEARERAKRVGELLPLDQVLLPSARFEVTADTPRLSDFLLEKYAGRPHPMSHVASMLTYLTAAGLDVNYLHMGEELVFDGHQVELRRRDGRVERLHLGAPHRSRVSETRMALEGMKVDMLHELLERQSLYGLREALGRLGRDELIAHLEAAIDDVPFPDARLSFIERRYGRHSAEYNRYLSDFLKQYVDVHLTNRSVRVSEDLDFSDLAEEGDLFVRLAMGVDQGAFLSNEQQGDYEVRLAHWFLDQEDAQPLARAAVADFWERVVAGKSRDDVANEIYAANFEAMQAEILAQEAAQREAKFGEEADFEAREAVASAVNESRVDFFAQLEYSLNRWSDKDGIVSYRYLPLERKDRKRAYTKPVRTEAMQALGEMNWDELPDTASDREEELRDELFNDTLNVSENPETAPLDLQFRIQVRDVNGEVLDELSCYLEVEEAGSLGALYEEGAQDDYYLVKREYEDENGVPRLDLSLRPGVVLHVDYGGRHYEIREDFNEIYTEILQKAVKRRVGRKAGRRAYKAQQNEV